ncbi:hypothetical protein TNCV_1196971 [Trichonephila clavipes]|uniref:Uncharacterized protein n=1 Tax=Trichonephila clavipes TaxID=2585209 RepID=A0A8X6SBD8_TRICX|nr:hypothetical protein TNCV_1196971 [Trichonephila clavipes]
MICENRRIRGPFHQNREFNESETFKPLNTRSERLFSEEIFCHEKSTVNSCIFAALLATNVLSRRPWVKYGSDLGSLLLKIGLVEGESKKCQKNYSTKPPMFSLYGPQMINRSEDP